MSARCSAAAEGSVPVGASPFQTTADPAGDSGSSIDTVSSSQFQASALPPRIERQSEPDFECVLVDDGSTDGCLEISHDFASRDCRIRVFSKPRQGLVPTLIEGAAHCRSPIIARMDADD